MEPRVGSTPEPSIRRPEDTPQVVRDAAVSLSPGELATKAFEEAQLKELQQKRNSTSWKAFMTARSRLDHDARRAAFFFL